MTTDGKSVDVSRQLAGIKSLCNSIERGLKDEVQKMLGSGQLTPPVLLCLEHRGSETFVVIDSETVEFNLNRQLSAPPL